MEQAQRLMYQVGLTTPTKRFIGISAAVAAGLYYFKPSMFFIGSMPRAWSVMGGGPTTTIVPAWLAALGSGAVAGTML